METNTKTSLEKTINYLEEKYSKQISPKSNILFILTVENKLNILSSIISPNTNKYRKTVGIPIKDASNYNTSEIKGNIFENYVQLDSGLVIPKEFATELNAKYSNYITPRKITHCINYHL